MRDKVISGEPPFLARVIYIQPEFKELKRRFPVYVDPAYNRLFFESVKSCEKVSCETREVEFEIFELGGNAFNDDVLVRIDRRLLRPAMFEELLAFAAKYFEEWKGAIYALGSEARVGNHRVVACLPASLEKESHSLRLAPVGSLGWTHGSRFLAVNR